ncbi:MAG: TolC family protein, partial [Candidatus Sericytochromatia bacterium]
MIKRLIPIILISVLNIGEVRAEEQKTITLDEVFKSVENTYPSVIISKKDRLIADHKLLASQGSFDTVFNAKGEARPLGYYQNGSYDVYVEQPTTLWGSNFFSGLKIGGGKYATYEGKNETNDLGEIRTGFEIPLLKDGITDRRRTNIVQAEIKQYESDMKIIKKLIESKQNASQKYWKWVSTGQIYKIQEDILYIAQNRDKSLLESSKLGQIANIESVENKRVIFQRQSSLVSAERSLQTAAMDLSIYLRNSSGETLVPELINLPTKIEEINILSQIDLKKDIDTAINNNPEIKIIQAMIKQAESELKYLENQNLPEIDFSLAISQDFGKGSKTRDQAVLDT